MAVNEWKWTRICQDRVSPVTRSSRDNTLENTLWTVRTGLFVPRQRNGKCFNETRRLPFWHSTRPRTLENVLFVKYKLKDDIRGISFEVQRIENWEDGRWWSQLWLVSVASAINPFASRLYLCHYVETSAAFDWRINEDRRYRGIFHWTFQRMQMG